MFEHRHERGERHPIRFVESSPRARRWFWFVVLIWISLVVFLVEFDTLFPVSGTVQDQIATLVNRSRFALLSRIAFYVTFSIIILILAMKVVRTGQWPPAGMQVPFRTRVQEIHRPIKVWIYTISILILHSISVGLSIYTWQLRNQFFEENIRLLAPPTSKGVHN